MKVLRNVKSPIQILVAHYNKFQSTVMSVSKLYKVMFTVSLSFSRSPMYKVLSHSTKNNNLRNN